ncbi:hypothetical protein CCACVL1_08716 [Corchorus capsularis]|uniref:Uncharacterized protein n=1 Tax=Corchorus capsularis TaxID=210143 RepID=A0A1R3IZ62_COCAP|nr:hypothetical protein CCACVL1_08716 [Corchorus capsularis]
MVISGQQRQGMLVEEFAWSQSSKHRKYHGLGNISAPYLKLCKVGKKL